MHKKNSGNSLDYHWPKANIGFSSWWISGGFSNDEYIRKNNCLLWKPTAAKHRNKKRRWGSRAFSIPKVKLFNLWLEYYRPWVAAGILPFAEKMLLPEIHNSKMMKIISLCAKKESPTLSHLNFMPNFSVKILSGLVPVEEGRFTDTVFMCLFEYDG